MQPDLKLNKVLYELHNLETREYKKNNEIKARNLHVPRTAMAAFLHCDLHKLK